MLRLILILLWIPLVLVVLGLPFLIIFWIIGLFNPLLKQKLAQGYTVFASAVITFLAGEKISVHGLENIPRDRAYLLISNHRSLFDILTAYRLPADAGDEMHFPGSEQHPGRAKGQSADGRIVEVRHQRVDLPRGNPESKG